MKPLITSYFCRIIQFVLFIFGKRQKKIWNFVDDHKDSSPMRTNHQTKTKDFICHIIHLKNIKSTFLKKNGTIQWIKLLIKFSYILTTHQKKNWLDCLIQSDWIYDTHSNSYAKINCENFGIMSSSDVQATHVACIQH